MLGDALNRLDAKLYDGWKEHADSFATLVKSGLEQIEFPVPKLVEIEKINEALAVLQSKNISREAYVNAMKKLTELLGSLAKNKNFKNNDINNFFFLSHRSGEYLNSLLLTKYNKYFEAYLNPTGKEQPKYEAGYFEHKGVGRAARDFTTYLLDDYEPEMHSTLKLSVQKLREKPVKITTESINAAAQTNILEAKIGKEQYQRAQSQVAINTILDVSVYLKEQIHGASFESFYMQVATLYGIISKVENVAVGTSVEEISKERQKLFDEAGFGDLNSINARNYLNAIAKNLGFNDAKDLHSNYQNLETEQGAQKFIEYKQSFVEYNNKEILASDDPLNAIKDLVQNENTRLKSKIKTPFYSSANNNHIKVVSYSANELLSSIKNAQRIANLSKVAAEDANKMMGDNLGFWGKVGMFAANWQKHRIDSYALSAFKNSTDLLLNRVNDDAESINKIWIARTNERIKQKRENRDKIIQNANSDIDGGELIKEYIAATITYKQLFQEYNKAQKELDINSPEYTQISERFKAGEENYNNYKDAFSLCANENIFNLSRENINVNIKNRESKINEINNKYEIKLAELGKLKDELKAESNRRNNTFGGRLARWRDNAAAFFGITTKGKQAIDEKEKQYKQLYAELEPLGLEIRIQMQLLTRTKELKQKFENASKQSATSLINTLRVELKELSKTYHELKLLFESSADENTSAIFIQQEQFRVKINSLSILTNELIQKFGSENDVSEMSSQILEEFMHEISAAQVDFNNFSPDITGIKNPTTINFKSIINNITQINESKKIIAQNTLLEKAKQIVTEAYQNAAIEKLIDPFSYSFALPNIILDDLSTNNRELLDKHIADEASALLTRMSESIAPKDLEKIYISLQTQANMSAHKIEKDEHEIKRQGHYQRLAVSVEKAIRIQLQKNNNLSLPELRKSLPKLSSEIIYLQDQADICTMNAHDMDQIVDSWIWNAFGIITHDKIESTKAQAKATEQLQRIYSTEFTTTLETFLKKAQGAFEAFEYDDLKVFIKMTTEMLEKLQSKRIVATCTNALEDILMKAKRAEQSHTHHHELSIHQELNNIEVQMIELNKIREKIDNEITVNSEANPELISEFKTIIAKINSDIEKTKTSVTDLKKIRSHLSPKYEALGVATFEEDNLGIIFEKRLDNIKIAVTENNKCIPRQMFFSDICKGSEPSSIESFTKDILGKGLLMALAHNNLNAASMLLNSKNTKEPIDVFALGTALPLAAKIGSLDLINRIINYNNAVFNEDTLNESLQVALSNGQLDIANYIVFNSDFLPNNESLKVIEELITQDSPISNVDRGVLQIFGDNDGATLEKMRSGYAFLEQLTSAIQTDLTELNQKTIHEKTTQTSDSLKDEINMILRKIGKVEELKEYLSNRYNVLYFETPIRRSNHIQKWNSEIDEELDSCHKTIQRLLNPKYVEPLVPPLSRVKEKAKEELSEFEIIAPPNVLDDIKEEERKRDVRVKLTQLQTLVDNGAILPSSFFPSPAETPPSTAQVAESEKLASKQIDSTIVLVNIENDIKTLLNKPYMTPKQLSEFGSKLKEYLHECSENNDRLSVFLQKSLYQLVKDNNSQAISILLDVTKDVLSHDILANALSQAIQSNAKIGASLLIEHHAFIGHENEILKKLLDKLDNDEFSSPSFTKTILFEFILNAKNVILIDPDTQKLDERITQFLAGQTDPKKTSKIPPVSNRLRDWYDGKDFSNLSQMRNAYVYAEQALTKLENDTFTAHLQKMLEINNQIDLPSQMEISMLEKELARLEENYQTHLNLISKTLNLYKNVIDDSKFYDPSRKDEDLAKWDSAFTTILSQHKSRFEDDIKHAKEALQECKAETVKLSSPIVEKRKSALISSAKQSNQPKNELESGAINEPNRTTTHKATPKK